MRPAASSAPHCDLAELVAAALPFTGLDELLLRLAGWWKNASGADEAVIGAVRDNGLLHCAGSCADRDNLPPPVAVPALERVADLVSSACSAAPGEQPVRQFALQSAGRIIGAIALVAPTETDFPEEWFAVTAELVGHARELESRLRDSRLAALAEFAAGAGHEINNPLASILICAQRLQQVAADPEFHRLAATIGGQALRIRDMIGDVMLFARPPVPDRKAIDPSTAIRDVLESFSGRIAQASIEVHSALQPCRPVMADPVQFRVVISEVLRNAVEVQPQGGRIDVMCRDSVRRPGHVEIGISDRGPGLDETARRHLFDPFFSGRAAGRGLGFGLCKAWRIVTLHGGQIDAHEPADGGLSVLVEWPCAPEPGSRSG